MASTVIGRKDGSGHKNLNDVAEKGKKKE